MQSNSDFLDLVYETAFDPTMWTPVLERFGDMIGGTTAWISQLSVEDGAGGSERDPMARVDPVWPRAYIEHFAQRNPLHHVDNPRDYLRRWTPRILTDEDWMAREDFVRSEFYNDFWRPQDIESCVMIRLAVRGEEIATLNYGRPGRRGRFEQSDLELMDRCHPHLIRAFDLGRRFAAVRRLSGELASILDGSPHGLFLLDGDGRVRHANRAADALATQGSGLRVIGGRLTASAGADARRLAALIGAAADVDGEQRRGGSMSLTAPGRRLPLSITVAPMGEDRFADLHRGRTALVCVTDLEADVSLPEQRLRELFALTPAEARLALAIFEGSSLGEAAESFGVSTNTVRVQLARIFDKTGTNRQSELVRLMMRSIGLDVG